MIAPGRRELALAAALGLTGALGFAGVGAAAPAPLRDPRIERVSVEDGLPDGTVYSVAQDAEGFLWFGTEYGLARYDGYGFNVYTHDPADPLSISSNQASHVFVDSRGRLWVGTWGGGLERYEPAVDGFRHLPYRPDSEDGLADSHVQTLFEDGSGLLWLGLNGGGLQRYDPEAGELVSYRHDPDDPATLSHDRVWDILEDGSGMLWVATSEGLDRLDPGTGRVRRHAACPEPVQCLPHEEVRALMLDGRNRLWIGTRRGLAVRDPDGGLEVFRQGDNGLVHDYVNEIVEDRSGRIWVGTGFAGLHLWQPEDGRFRVFRHEIDTNTLSHDDVRSIFEDRSGLLWIGTRGEGVNKLDPRVAFSRYRYKPDDPESGLGDHRVWAIVKDPDERIWVGTQGGLDRIDRRRDRILHLRHDPDDPRGLGRGEVRALYRDADGELWLGTSLGVLQRLASDGPGPEDLEFESFPEADFRGADIRVLTDGPDGHLWIGTNAGIFVFDRQAGRPVLHLREEGEPTRALEFDNGGRLWIGTRGEGIDRYDPGSERFPESGNPDAESGPLDRTNVLSLRRDRRGTLWVGTRGNGLYRQEGTNGSFRQYTALDGLASNVVHAIVEDERGHLWLSTNRGVSRLDPVTERFRNYDEGDGLQGNTFLPGSSHRAPDGEVFFGGPNGLTAFYPAEVEQSESTYVPPVLITSVRLFGQPITAERPAWLLPSIELGPEDDYLSIQFAALDFSRPERNRFIYRLEGYDRDWVEAGSRREATYTNLDGGDYIFRVRGATAAGNWNQEGAMLRIRVVPPLVERGWFRAVVLLMSLLAVVLVVQARLRSARRTRRRLEALVRQRTAELEAKTEELEQAYKVAEEISYTDPLTGLRNRRFLLDTIEPDVARALREHERWLEEGSGRRPDRFDLLFVIADLDRFKAINDSHGHRVGDQVLEELAELLRARCRESDLIVRWGGEEFLLLCRFLDRSQAPVLLEHLRTAVEEFPFRLDERRTLSLTCSFGFAAFPFDPERPRAIDWEQALELADHALYEAKRSGRNTWAGLAPGPEGATPGLSRAIPGGVEQQLEHGKLAWLRPDPKRSGS